jgi:hypothetical protein
MRPILEDCQESCALRRDVAARSQQPCSRPHRTDTVTAAPNAPPTITPPHVTARSGSGTRIVAPLEGAPAAVPPDPNGLTGPSLDAAEGENQSDAARVLARVRRLMLISSALTLAAILVVLGLVGYRLSRSSEYHGTDLALTLPKGAKILQTAVAEDRIVVTLDTGGAIEIRTYDLHSLKPMGRLSFGFAP